MILKNVKAKGLPVAYAFSGRTTPQKTATGKSVSI
jgi:hypothetical protein